MISWTQTFVGEKVIVSPHAYSEKVKHRAVAVVVDKRRPNKVKPIYKMKTFYIRTPCAYRVKGVGLIVHPEIHDRLMKHMRKSIIEQERRIFTDIFGSSNIPSTASIEDIRAALKLINDKEGV